MPLMLPHIELAPYPSIQATIKQVTVVPPIAKPWDQLELSPQWNRIKNHSAHIGDLHYPSSSRYQTPPQLLQGDRFKQWHH
ncbi:hypothetical protein SynSYN20_01371 [Synechococcus sp. SYN20]|nr:hypothetical protein SynSYN20_01371 [Synechococcus sp. SYN20]